MELYKPSQKAPVSGLVLTFIISVVAGVAIGALASFIGQWLYLIIFFPLIMGGVTGAAVAQGVRLGKLRNPILAALLGIVAGIVCYTAMHATDYYLFLRDLRAYGAEQAPAGTTAADVDNLINLMLLEETGQEGFAGFILLEAQEGVSIGQVGRSNETNIGSTFTWIYFAIELIIITVLSAALGYTKAKEPFCEERDAWYDNKTYVGFLDIDAETVAKQKLIDNGVSALAQSLKTGFPQTGLHFYLLDVVSQDSERQILQIEKATLDSKGRQSTKSIFRGYVSHEQAQLLKAQTA